ncbi:GntR family transcriptional regulator [Spirillospora sp. NPDC029432]|uniref:GntR family transcriptional regulator n=1 Tax=Spirillospora sp. NPDC029432 TaxID=3154599 RepID=UPI00345525D0
MPARYEEIAADLQKKIKAGELKPGQRLKTEKELMAEYGSARNTVRDAINRLKVLRLVQSRQGSGNFVVKQPELFKITLTPEKETGFSGGEGEAWTTEASKQGRDAWVSSTKVLIEQADETQSRELGINEGDDLILRHQRRYITDEADEDVPWSMQTSYYPFSFVERGAAALKKRQDIEEGTMAYLEEKLGIRQDRYTDTLWIRPPDEDERDFFKLPAESSVWVYEHKRTVYDTEDRPCRYTVTVYPTDRNEFVIEARLPR